MRLRLTPLMLLPILAGCALGPAVPKPDTRLPVAFEAPADVTQPGAPLDHWWTAYNDPQLESLIQLALVNAPDARTAYAKLEDALAVRAGALASYGPQGAFQGSATDTYTNVLQGPAPIVLPIAGFPPISFTNAGNTQDYLANFDVSWEIDIFGRKRAARGKANADLAVARLDDVATITELEASVADQLFQARGLAIQLDDAREANRIDQQLADIARKKADHGLGSSADADQAAATAAQSAAQVTDLEGQLHAARRTLLVLVGKGAEPLATLPADAEAGTPPAVPATVPSELLARRPDVREAAQQIRSATGQLKLDELALFPKFTLSPGVGLTSEPLFGASLTSDVWSIGVGMVQPILDLPRLKTVIRSRGAQADEAVIAYEKAVQTAYGESENALVQLSADEQRVKILTTGEAQARSAYDAARKRYAYGIDDLTSTLSAEQTWRTTRAALTSAEVQALRRSVTAFKALGGGWTPGPVPTQQAAR
ncbi:MAG TPA: efflux transporter outer membrane subunit [Caulobacteraceae bacterium]|nr:efflux transporter outer membrane subunit [Caulobacteraceae bacterium]